MKHIKVIIFLISICCSISGFSHITDDDYVNAIDSIRGDAFEGFSFIDAYDNRNNQNNDDLELDDLSNSSNNGDETENILNEDEKENPNVTPLM